MTAASCADVAISGDRLRRHLEALSAFGRPEGGTFTSGVTRLAYSDADVAARRFVIDLMRDAGLSVRIDPAGNIVGRSPHTDPSIPPIVCGSHIDTVPDGGNFDGALGSLAAIEVARTLGERGIRTRHPLEVAIWADEEGVSGRGLWGSRAAVGRVAPDELDGPQNAKAAGVRRIGGDPARIDEAVRRPGSIHAYIELHVEQGPTLERCGTAIGVVEGIVTVDRYEVVVDGTLAHAGTPMNARRDALLAASHVVLAVRDVVASTSGRHVGTVGEIAVYPNTVNVVPGRVRLSIDVRDVSTAALEQLAGRMAERVRAIADDTQTSIAFERSSRQEGAAADSRIQVCIRRVCNALGVSSMPVTSAAGHDAQELARLCPMGMIFVPSVGGISHAPAERTNWEDCARGASVLLHSVLLADLALD